MEFRYEVSGRLAAAHGPRARLQAVVDACFAASQFRPESCAAWLAFWAQAPFAPPLGRLRRLYLARLRSTLVADLRSLLPESRVEAAAMSIGSMIDGLFLRAASGDGSVTPDLARELVTDLVDQLVAHRQRPSEPI